MRAVIQRVTRADVTISGGLDVLDSLSETLSGCRHAEDNVGLGLDSRVELVDLNCYVIVSVREGDVLFLNAVL